MHYRALVARTPAQRGAVGNWLVLSRIARGWDTQEKARAEIERLAGWRIPQSVYAEWESGRRVPSDKNLARLQEFYGTTEALEATESTDSLAAAIRAQTETISALLEEIRAERQARVEWEQGFLEAMRELGKAGAPQGDLAPEPRVVVRR